MEMRATTFIPLVEELGSKELLELGGPNQPKKDVLAVLLDRDHITELKALANPVALFAALNWNT